MRIGGARPCQDALPVLTAIVSDLHLGTSSGADIALRPRVRDRLVEGVAAADRVVLLGDLLELRERPAPAVLELAAPFLDALAAAVDGKQVVIAPGNHDHELVAPALEAARLDGAGPLRLEAEFSPKSGELARRVAARMPGAEVVLAYPGVRLRDDVYATHGHYLDMHLTVPRVECVIASAVARVAGVQLDGERLGPDAYEAALSPIYAFAHSVVQRAQSRGITRGGTLSRSVWSAARPDGRRRLSGVVLGRVGIPAGVAALNLIGLGPYRADISAEELRRAGLRAIAETIDRLGVVADHVIFGHTHRAGPLPGDTEGWSLPGGTRLHNTGSWLHERVFLGDAHDPGNPYWPGSVTYLRDEGPPELVNVLGDLELRS